MTTPQVYGNPQQQNRQWIVCFISSKKVNLNDFCENIFHSMEGEMVNEQRIFQRLSLHVPVIINNTEKGEMKNISIGGLCLITGRSINKGCNINLKFSMPGNEEIESQGCIIWSHKKSEYEYECGLEFEHITVNNYERIRKYIKAREGS